MLGSQSIKRMLPVTLCAITAQGLAAQDESYLLERLRADYTALVYSRAEFERAEKGGIAGSSELADYAFWIQELSDQVTQTCHQLSEQSLQLVAADIPCVDFTLSYSPPVSIEIDHETTDAEKTAAIEDQFNDSLGEFDEKLLQEQDRVKTQRPRTESADPNSGAMAGGSAGSEAGATAEGNKPNEGDQQDESTAVSDQPSSGGPGSPSVGSRSNTPDDIPDGSDDDIIARQLREAAEKETDPELQKKLWEEYRRYKSGK
jgi:hypothetical protein